MIEQVTDTPATDRITSKLGLPLTETTPNKRAAIKAFAAENPERFTELTAITTRVPPDHIHRMQRADPLWVGDIYSSDMVLGALGMANVPLENECWLDLGCSSGSLLRIIRVFEDWQLHGCDPIDSAVDWAAQNIAGVSFCHMNVDPPLPFESETFTGVSAVSIWSHHSPKAARNWLAETFRILKPGGWVALTYCGPRHLEWSEARGRRSKEVLDKMAEDLRNQGFNFTPMNYAAEDSDTTEDWGHAVYRTDWFSTLVTDAGFDIALTLRGANQGNQDVMILRKP